MSRYALSPAARADLEQIWDYTCERWNDSRAEEYVHEIRRAIERLVDNPMFGRACDEVRSFSWRRSSHGGRNGHGHAMVAGCNYFKTLPCRWISAAA